MYTMNTKKIFAVVFIAIMIVSLVLFALGKLSGLVFFIIAAICALFAFRIIPRLKY
jgi:hypothetical protein